MNCLLALLLPTFLSLLFPIAHAADWKEATIAGRDVEAGVYSFQEIEGDFDLTAMVGALPKHGRFALMVRESLAVDARFEMIYVMDDGRVGTDARLGELAYHSPGKSESPKPLPIRLRAARCGDEIALYVVDAQPCTPPRIRDQATLRGLSKKVLAGVWMSSANDKASVSAVKLAPLVLPYRTSWLGNSLAGSERGIQQQVQGLAVEPVSGRIYLNAHGTPQHDWTAKQRFTPPAGFAEAGRLFYESATDTLHIGGFAEAQPRKGSEFKQFGNELRAYAGWLRGDRREAGKITLPFVPKGKGGHEAFSAQTLWVAGDYVFIGISASAEVLAYHRATGKLQHVFGPGPEVGGRAGLLDLTHAVNAIQRRDGSYRIFVESNDQAKILIYEWDEKTEATGR